MHLYKTLSAVLFIFTLLPSHAAQAATAVRAKALTAVELQQQLAAKDAEFFQRGFNQCDLAYLDANISPALEFFHDRGGFQNKALFMANTKQYICGNPAQKPIRQLVAGSLSTFPLYQNGLLYGAVQHGEHQFYLRQPGMADMLTGSAKFSSVWLKQDQQWLLKSVLSYDHQPAPTVAAAAAATTKLQPDAPTQKMNALLKKLQVPALGLGIIENGQLKSVKVYGELSADVPAPQNTIFKVASLTKPIVTMVTLRLVAQGKLSLDESLAKYWVDPEIKDDPRHLLLTPRLLLSHQSGFPNWRYMTPTNTLAFEFTPGSKHQYSGEGFEYLRQALEAKFGQSIETLAEQLVFKPAGMTDTRFWWDEHMDEQRYAQNHDIAGKVLPLQKYDQANAAANLLSTVEDYSKFLLFVMAQAKGMPALYQQMQTSQVQLKQGRDVGLGWEMLSQFPNNEVALLHSGKDPGVFAMALFFPKSRNGYVIFTNGDNAGALIEQILPSMYLGAELWQQR